MKWTDIDLDAGTLRVNRQIQRMRRDGNWLGTLEFSEPKNASRRTIDFPQRAVEALRSHRKKQAEEKLRATDYEDSGLMFATGKGTPIDAQNIINRFFKPLLKRAQLPDIRWHDLRHTYATVLAVQGHAPDLRTEVDRARLGAANPGPLLPPDALDGPQHRRRDRRSVGLGDLLWPFSNP